MNIYVLFAILGICILLIFIIVFQCIRYRRMIKKKNMGIFQKIKEQNHLAEELERMRIEKEVLVKILNNQLKSDD